MIQKIESPSDKTSRSSSNSKQQAVVKQQKPCCCCCYLFYIRFIFLCKSNEIRTNLAKYLRMRETWNWRYRNRCDLGSLIAPPLIFGTRQSHAHDSPSSSSNFLFETCKWQTADNIARTNVCVCVWMGIEIRKRANVIATNLNLNGTWSSFSMISFAFQNCCRFIWRAQSC